MVFQPIPWRVCPLAQNLPVRVLSQVHEDLHDSQETHGRCNINMYGIPIWGCGLWKRFFKEKIVKICELIEKIIYSFIFFKAKCVWRHPPGDEIYRNKNISMFEVDGKRNKVETTTLFSFKSHKMRWYYTVWSKVSKISWIVGCNLVILLIVCKSADLY